MTLSMEYHVCTIIISVSFCIIFQHHVEGAGGFSENYQSLWGTNHFSLVGGKEVQLLFDQSSGSGFRSKLIYGSGSFQIRMKTSNKPTDGVVTTFYLNSANYGEDSKPHDEVDFEIFGKTPTLQTNVFANDNGNREQRFTLWFDPCKDFHTYTLVWNNEHILFSVDDIPIRVYKKVKGVNFPKTPMRIEASTWHATWAAGDVDWSKAPFISHYRSFDVTACSPPKNCASPELSWNKQKELSSKQLELMRTYRNKYMTYDYCNTTANAQANTHPECKSNTPQSNDVNMM